MNSLEFQISRCLRTLVLASPGITIIIFNVMGLFVYLELTSVANCNKVSAVLAMGKRDMVAYRKIVRATRPVLVILPIKLLLKQGGLFTI